MFRQINQKDIQFGMVNRLNEVTKRQRYFYWKEAEEFFRSNFPIHNYMYISFDKCRYLYDSQEQEYIAVFDNLDEDRQAFTSLFIFAVSKNL